jgi:hypothetical protein
MYLNMSTSVHDIDHKLAGSTQNGYKTIVSAELTHELSVFNPSLTIWLLSILNCRSSIATAHKQMGISNCD